MEKELEELRRSRPKPQDGGDFTLSDCFYFSRRGIESIVEDEVQMDSPVTVRQLQFPSFPTAFSWVFLFKVTQRFSSEELVSWNLLTRTNNNFHYISLKLTLVYGLGVFVRYCILTPLRYTKHPYLLTLIPFLNHSDSIHTYFRYRNKRLNGW